MYTVVYILYALLSQETQPYLINRPNKGKVMTRQSFVKGTDFTLEIEGVRNDQTIMGNILKTSYLPTSAVQVMPAGPWYLGFETVEIYILVV